MKKTTLFILSLTIFLASFAVLLARSPSVPDISSDVRTSYHPGTFEPHEFVASTSMGAYTCVCEVCGRPSIPTCPSE